jgi:hypothetical protein
MVHLELVLQIRFFKRDQSFVTLISSFSLRHCIVTPFKTICSWREEVKAKTKKNPGFDYYHFTRSLFCHKQVNEAFNVANVE